MRSPFDAIFGCAKKKCRIERSKKNARKAINKLKENACFYRNQPDVDLYNSVVNEYCNAQNKYNNDYLFINRDNHCYAYGVQLVDKEFPPGKKFFKECKYNAEVDAAQSE